MIEFKASLHADDMVMLTDSDGTVRALVYIDFFGEIDRKWGDETSIIKRLNRGETICFTAHETERY
jgi:hypothetical protein